MSLSPCLRVCVFVSIFRHWKITRHQLAHVLFGMGFHFKLLQIKLNNATEMNQFWLFASIFISCIVICKMRKNFSLHRFHSQFYPVYDHSLSLAMALWFRIKCDVYNSKALFFQRKFFIYCHFSFGALINGSISCLKYV